jgi:hypothetical protein
MRCRYSQVPCAHRAGADGADVAGLAVPRLTAAAARCGCGRLQCACRSRAWCARCWRFRARSAPLTRAWLVATPLGAVLAVLVQLLGTVIGVFLVPLPAGRARQRSTWRRSGGVLAAVHLLLLADHWVVLIAAWALVGTALQHLLCFYPDRPFALLAAHKKRLADRAADVLLLAAAGLAWWSVGSGSFTGLAAHLRSMAPRRRCRSARCCWCWRWCCAPRCCRCMAG